MKGRAPSGPRPPRGGPGERRARVNPRARLREDRAGDPLDGLVNLFDLGIVLSVAFLIAALSSLNLSPASLQDSSARSAQQAQLPADAVLAEPEAVRPVKIKPGQEVIGRGEPVGTVYRLRDGRTVIVREQPRP